ncbi:modulator protein [Nitratireductor aestuarii]|uniref:Modulator protein n=1 Tax=Nitratireductor aestuarii TaxID=1735103 RepID=A0A916W6X9_9HYPH|nr:TldD/PmbA family protein [Nitratireductor aestuarii]GGA71484.1 modulator protein [Nitratireductor aestuarii]
MSVASDQQILVDRVAELVEAAKRAGADAADAVVMRSRASSVSVRLGKVEGTESSESDDMSLRVFVGQRVASVSAAMNSDAAALAERAVAMAKVSPEDPYQTLADPHRLATEILDLDLVDPTEVSAERLTQDALAAEEAALAVEGVTNSSGASASAGAGGLVLATSHGFVGAYSATRFSRVVSVIAGSGTGMETDYDFSSRLHFADLEAPDKIGRTAGERAVKRLNSRRIKTGVYPVVYDPRMARGIAGSIAAAINGASVARKTSFLRDKMGQQIASAGITITDEPLRRRGPSSRPFDGEGVQGEKLVPVENGVLKSWMLSTSVARELGLETNGRGVRSASSVTASSTNFAIEPGDVSPEELIAGIKNGFYVTDLFGHGTNLITGDYSRGAAGFWIENGEIAYPVSEITIASNLRDMFMRMVPANDLDRNFGTAAPTLLIEGMTVAGE